MDLAIEIFLKDNPVLKEVVDLLYGTTSMPRETVDELLKDILRNPNSKKEPSSSDILLFIMTQCNSFKIKQSEALEGISYVYKDGEKIFDFYREPPIGISQIEHITTMLGKAISKF